MCQWECRQVGGDVIVFACPFVWPLLVCGSLPSVLACWHYTCLHVQAISEGFSLLCQTPVSACVTRTVSFCKFMYIRVFLVQCT